MHDGEGRRKQQLLVLQVSVEIQSLPPHDASSCWLTCTCGSSSTCTMPGPALTISSFGFYESGARCLYGSVVQSSGSPRRTPSSQRLEVVKPRFQSVFVGSTWVLACVRAFQLTLALSHFTSSFLTLLLKYCPCSPNRASGLTSNTKSTASLGLLH